MKLNIMRFIQISAISLGLVSFAMAQTPPTPGEPKRFPQITLEPVSYTHLTLPTNREV